MNESKKQEYNLKKGISSIFFALMIIASVTITIVPVSANISSQENTFNGRTPFQSAIKERLEQTDIKNNRVSVMTTSDHTFDPNNIEFNTEVLEKSENHVKLEGTTVIKFDNPLEAGYVDNKWPKLQVTENPELIGEGTVIPGDYDQAVKDYILTQIQNIEDADERQGLLAAWNEYDWESGQRKNIIKEYYVITYPEEDQSVLSYATMSGASTTTNDVLMGFTWTAPKIDWVIESQWVVELCVPFTDICTDFTVYKFKAGVYFDAALGLRLPTEVTMNHPDEMYETLIYTPSTSIEGVNWNAAQYTAANVPAENGNEFVARIKFFAGIEVEILEINVIDWNVDINRDYGSSYKTPFGPGEEFPIPDLYLSPDDTGLKWGWNVASLGIGFTIDPEIGSQTITADWSASGDATGSGIVTYHQSNVPYNFGPVTAGDYGPTDYANLQLYDYKYYFDICKFDVDANIILHFGFDLGSFGGYSLDKNVPIDLITIDASDFTGNLYLGTHSGTTADTADASIFVIPTADVSITKSDSGVNAVAGEQYQYILTVHNGGPSDANEIKVTDNLPVGMTFVSATGATCSAVGQVVTCDPFDIPAGGDDVIITITVDVASSVPHGTILTNLANADSTTHDLYTYNNDDIELTVVEAKADLSITKTDSTDPVIEDEPFNYTVTVYNNGPSDAVNVQVTDTLPSNVTFVSTNGCNEDPNGVPTCTLGTIPAGTQATYTIMVTGDSWGMITNMAEVSSDTQETDPSNNIATEDTYVVVPNQPGIELSIPGISLSGVDRNVISGSLVIQNEAFEVPSMVIETINVSVFSKVSKKLGGSGKFELIDIQSCTITPDEPTFVFEGAKGETKTVGFSCMLLDAIPPDTLVKVTPEVTIFNRDKIFHHSISQDFP